jgi:hypothetical protein
MHVYSTRTRPVEVGPGHGTWPAGWYTVVAAPPPRVHMRGRVYLYCSSNCWHARSSTLAYVHLYCLRATVCTYMSHVCTQRPGRIRGFNWSRIVHTGKIRGRQQDGRFEFVSRLNIRICEEFDDVAFNRILRSNLLTTLRRGKLPA